MIINLPESVFTIEVETRSRVFDGRFYVEYVAYIKCGNSDVFSRSFNDKDDAGVSYARDEDEAKDKCLTDFGARLSDVLWRSP